MAEVHSVMVTCEHCDGSGRRDLTHTERVTLAAVWLTEWSSTADIRDRLGRSKVKNEALLPDGTVRR